MSDVAAAPESVETLPKNIYLVPYPKVVFLYPTFLAALVAGVYIAIVGPTGLGPEIAAILFLGVMALNLVVLSFDFPRTASLTLFFLLFGIVMGLLLLFRSFPDLLPTVTDTLRRFRPLANATFYFTIAGILGVIYAIVLVKVRFDYWELRPNELLHHTGMMSNLKRYGTAGLRIDKEINDVFEYVLLSSGTLVIHPPQDGRVVVLENVPGISGKEKQITRLLGATQVRVQHKE